MLPLLLLFSCAPTTTESTQLPPPPQLTLDVSPMVRGEQAIWEIDGAPPGAEVLLFSSAAGVGPGPCDPSLGGACLGVRSPVTLLGRYTANALGSVRVERAVPTGAGPAFLAFQAVARNASAAALTGPVSRQVTANPALRTTTVYDEQLAPGWRIETWPCYGQGSPTHDLTATSLVRFGSVAAEFLYDCDGGWSGLGFDRGTAGPVDWFPNQAVGVSFRFHPGAELVDDAELELTVDRGPRGALPTYLSAPDAAGWRTADVPLADLHGGRPFHAFMLFSDSPTLRPQFYVDRVELRWRDDVRAPVLSPLLVSGLTPAEATVSWQTDELTQAEVRVRVGAATTFSSLDWSTTHSLDLEDLPADTQVEVTVTVNDHQEVGPTRRTTDLVRFRTLPADLTAPVLSDLRVSRQGATVATVCWTTDEPATSSVLYDGRVATDPRLSTAHCLDLPHLPTASTVAWTARSADRWGNVGTASAPLPVQTGPLPTYNVSLPLTDSVPFTSEMRGVNLVNWSMMWGRPYPTSSPVLRELTRLIAPGVLRHAGGNWSNHVRWDPADAQCGPAATTGACQRVPYTHPQPGLDTCGPTPTPVWRAYTHAYEATELDAIAQFADEVGAGLMMQVNARTCDPEQWADLVHWANVVRGYDVHWWEIGNEFDLIGALGDTQVPIGADYAATFAAYHQAMTSIDPSIALVGPASSQHVDDPVFLSISGMTEPFLDDPQIQAPGVLGALSFHHYATWNGERDITADELLAWGDPVDSASRASLDHAVTPWRDLLDARGMHDTPIAITEVAPLVAARPTRLNTNHVGALYMLDALPRLAWAGADLAVAWDLYDDVEAAHFGLIDQGPSRWLPTGLSTYDLLDAYSPRPAWYAYLLLAQWFGDTLVDHAQPSPDVAVWVSEGPDGLYVLVVNTGDDAATLNLSFPGRTPVHAERWVLSNPTFVEAADPESVPGGTSVNGIEVESGSAIAVAQSFGAIDGSAPVEAVVGGVLAVSVGAYEAEVVRVGW